MNDIPETEARACLAGKLFCIDAEEWSPMHMQNGAFEITAGLLDSNDVRTQLQVNLIFKHSAKTKFTTYLFGVFKRQPWGIERVYQLDVRQSKLQIHSLHDLPHEHIGSTRIDGDLTWSRWTFDQAMDHFCQQTNIDFSPIIESPMNFSLKG